MLFSKTEKGKVYLDYQAIADEIIHLYTPITFQQDIWFYVDGLYRQEQGEILSFVAEVARAAGYGPITSAIREVRAYVSAHRIATEYPFDRYPAPCPWQTAFWKSIGGQAAPPYTRTRPNTCSRGGGPWSTTPTQTPT
jgi:hypothetical protein